MMSSQMPLKKRSYSPVYKIYRRLRFVRYRKKIIRNQQRETLRQELLEKKTSLARQKEFSSFEKKQHLIKKRAEKEEARKLKRELKEEFRQREILARQEFGELNGADRKKAVEARLMEKKRRKRLFRFYIKTRFRNFIQSFRSLNIRTVKNRIREFRENAPQRKLFAIISFNSTVLFLLSYFFLFHISQLATVISAGFFNYPTIVYYYEIYFNISAEAWYHDSVKTIFSSGPLVNFLIGIIFLILYTNLRETQGTFKLFFLWGFLHAINMLFGAMLIGTLFETGVGNVISWMYIMDTGRVMYSIVSIFILVIAGLLATKHFLISGNTYYNEINRSNRTAFIFPQVFMPYLLGNIFLILLRQPHFVFYDTFTVITLFIPVLAVLSTYRSYNDLFFEEEEKKAGISWISAGVLALAVIFFRVVLAIGIRLGG
jgi:hypothetical protein